MSDSANTLQDQKKKTHKETWTKELSIQNNTSQELPTHEKLKCNSVHSYFDALFFLPHKYLMKWVQTKAI